ncbi:MAG TPA: TetR/AcrR family transcriptional regulator [Streptosporangiaceae bacterium]|jgi:AcrR family transcriptional regulator
MARQSSVDRIADAALAILVSEGADAVTMRRVAAEAGVTAMATYKHFANRDALLRAVAEVGYQEVARTWDRRTGGAGFEARLLRLSDDLLDFALGKPHLYTFLITDRRPAANRFPEDFRAGASPAFTPVVEVMEQGVREGALRDDDPLEMALVLTSLGQGLIQMYTSGRVALPEKAFRDLFRRTVTRALDGLRA